MSGNVNFNPNVGQIKTPVNTGGSSVTQQNALSPSLFTNEASAVGEAISNDIKKSTIHLS